MSDVESQITQAVTLLKKKDFQKASAILNGLVPMSDKPSSHKGIMSKLDDFVDFVLGSGQLPIIVRGVAILMNVSKDLNNCDGIGKRAILTIIKLIKELSELQTVEYSIMLLRNLVRTDANRLLVKSTPGAVNDLVQTLVKYEPKVKSGTRNVVVNLASCIGLLAGNELVAAEMGKNDTLIPTLVKILKEHSSEEQLVVATLQALQYLAYYCEENGAKMCKYGLPNVLTPFLSQSGNVGKVSSTLNVILAQNESNVQDLEQSGQSDADGDDTLSILINQLRNDSDEDTQLRAITNLWSLASKESNREILRERLVTQELLRVLQTSSYVENIQESVGCLATMAQDPKTATLIAKQNGVPVMVRLLGVKDEYHIQLYAVTILGLMCILVDDVLNEVRKYELIPRLKNLFKATLAKEKELEGTEPKTKKVKEDVETLSNIITSLVRIFATFSREDDLCEEMEELGLLDTLIDIIAEGTNVQYGMEEIDNNDSEADILANAKKQQEESAKRAIKVAACTALWNMVNNERLKEKIYSREGTVAAMTMMLSEIDLSNSNSLLAKKNAGLSESELAELTKNVNKNSNLDMSNLEALQKRFAIQSGVYKPDDGDGEDFELEPEELEEEQEPEELEPAELEPAELEPAELKPKSIDEEVVELTPEEIVELTPAELEPEDIISQPVDKKQLEEERKKKEERDRKRIMLEKKREEKERKREEARQKKRQERLEKKKKQVAQAEKDEEYRKKRAAKRLMIVKELRSTEESYVNALQKMKKEFMEPLLTTKRGLLPQDKVKTIFSDVGIIHMINRDFLRELNQLFDDIPDLEANIEAKIGDLFLRRAATFKLYSNYVNNYDVAEMTMHDCLRKFKPFAQFLEEVSDKLLEEGLRQTDLASHLILPIQRLPRYSLLLSDLIKHSDADPNSSGYIFLQSALVEINRITSVVNENKRNDEFRERANEIGRKLGIKWLEKSRFTTWKRTEEKLPLYTYEKFRPTATRSKKMECNLYVLNDTIIIQRTDAALKKVYEIPLHDVRCDKKVADKDRQGLCLTIEDTRESQGPEESRIVFELVFPNRSLRDDIVQQVRNAKLNLHVI
jgi:hypothetical protein